MAIIFAMSDIHGEINIFKEMLELVDMKNAENQLILLGDYLNRDYQNYDSLYFIKELSDQYPTQVTVLMGNHELMFLEDILQKAIPFDDKVIIKWLRSLHYYHETETQIFVHAGIDEEAGEYWKWGSEDYYFCYKYPHSIGKFEKDIIAGHIGTCTIANDESYHQVFWDGESHFYIDGTTEVSKIIPLLKYDTNTKRYSSFEKIIDNNGGFTWAEFVITR